MKPLVSICIPSYKQPEFLERILQSIAAQDYDNIEVVISDDTPGDDVKEVADKYVSRLRIRYYHNNPSLGTPANWNAALDKARGELMMLLHHDDWLTTPQSVSKFAAPFSDASVDVSFGRSMVIDKLSANKSFDYSGFNMFYNNPSLLLNKCAIGPPSNVMVRRSTKLRYDNRYIWLVDIEYYVRLLLAGNKFYYIDEQLITVGVHDEQVTNYCATHPDVVIRENVWYANQHETAVQKTFALYDYYWRFFRNNGVRSIKDLFAQGLTAREVPSVIKKIIQQQSRIPVRLLNMGAVSKICSTASFLLIKTKRTSLA